MCRVVAFSTDQQHVADEKAHADQAGHVDRTVLKAKSAEMIERDRRAYLTGDK